MHKINSVWRNIFYRLLICLSRAGSYPNLLSAPCGLSLTRLRSAPSRKVMLEFLLELPMQLHYIAKQGYYIFSRATKIFKLVLACWPPMIYLDFLPLHTLNMGLHYIILY